MVKAVKIRKYITSVNMGNITSKFYLKLRYGKKCQQKHTVVKYICTNTLSLSLSLSEIVVVSLYLMVTLDLSFFVSFSFSQKFYSFIYKIHTSSSTCISIFYNDLIFVSLFLFVSHILYLCSIFTVFYLF